MVVEEKEEIAACIYCNGTTVVRFGAHTFSVTTGSTRRPLYSQLSRPSASPSSVRHLAPVTSTIMTPCRLKFVTQAL